MTTFEKLTTSQKVRAALHRDVRAICSESCHLLGLEVSKPAMEIIAELVYKKLSVYGSDLEAFAKHAKRSTINSEDVKLLARRNPSLKVRAALHRDVRAICSESCHLLGLEVSKPAMEIIAELVYKKLSVYGSDLEAFAKHAKRSTINSEDVKLLARRNPSLKTHLNKIVPTNPITTKEKRRKTFPAAKQQETPAKTKDSNLKEVTNVTKVSSNVTKSKDVEKERNDVFPDEDFVENMIVDDTIDLTFD